MGFGSEGALDVLGDFPEVGAFWVVERFLDSWSWLLEEYGEIRFDGVCSQQFWYVEMLQG